MEFLKSSELTLNSANYLVSTITNKPVTNPKFVNQQKAAEYIVKLSEAIKGKNFKLANVDSLDAIILQVEKDIKSSKTEIYVKDSTKPFSKVFEELTKHSLACVDFLDEKENNQKINEIMNTFNKINDVENMGDYFIESLVTLNKIYTIAEILEAVKNYNSLVN